ncbi:unnamed protein product [Gadus morhua 'NCC']
MLSGISTSGPGVLFILLDESEVSQEEAVALVAVVAEDEGLTGVPFDTQHASIILEGQNRFLPLQESTNEPATDAPLSPEMRPDGQCGQRRRISETKQEQCRFSPCNTCYLLFRAADPVIPEPTSRRRTRDDDVTVDEESTCGCPEREEKDLNLAREPHN